MRTGTRRGGRKDEEMDGGRCGTRGRALIGRLQQASEGGRDGTRERRPLTSSRTNQSVPSTPPSTPWARSTKACLPPAAVEGGPKPGGEPRAGRAVVWNERCERWGWGWKLTVLRPFACEWDEWARAESGRSERASRGSMSGWVWVGWVVGERKRETGKRATQPTGNAGRPIRQLASALWPAFSPLEVRPLPPIRPLSPQPASLSLFSPPQPCRSAACPPLLSAGCPPPPSPGSSPPSSGRPSSPRPSPPPPRPPPPPASSPLLPAAGPTPSPQRPRPAPRPRRTSGPSASCPSCPSRTTSSPAGSATSACACPAFLLASPSSLAWPGLASELAGPARPASSYLPCSGSAALLLLPSLPPQLERALHAPSPPSLPELPTDPSLLPFLPSFPPLPARPTSTRARRP